MKQLLEKIRRILRDRRIRRFLTRFVSATAAVVVFITTYALVLPAITMEKVADCGIEEHQHDDSCYTDELVCGIPESPGHVHTEACYETSVVLTCELEEHAHSAEKGCFDGEGNLLCTEAEHMHADACYKEVRELVCGQEESEGHTHGSACYEKVLTCGMEVHVHSTACYHADPADPVDPVEQAAVAASTSSASSASSSAASTGISTGSSAESVAAENERSSVTEDPSDSGNAGTNAGTGQTEGDDAGLTDATAGMTDTVSDEDAYIPSLDPVNFDIVLDQHTGIYYHHVEDGEVIEDSAALAYDQWDRVEDDADHQTELGASDLLRVYLSYSIPAGTLNVTNPVARYRLPANLHLTDDQVRAINENVNGIAGQYVNMSTLEILDTEKYYAYLGVEAVEGDRMPDEDPEAYARDLEKRTGDGSEYISAVVRVENVYDAEGIYGEKGAYLGQDLLFTFTPYSIGKNQHEYDAAGQPTKAGEKIQGWLTLDFNTSQVDWDEVQVSGLEREADPAAAKSAERREQTAEIVFVEEGLDEKGNAIHEISTELRLTRESETEEQDLAAAKEESAPVVIMPAMSFHDSIRVYTGRPAGLDENAGGTVANAADTLPEEAEVTVRVEADEGTFPAGTTMVLKAVDNLDAVAEAVTETVENTASESPASKAAEQNNNIRAYGFQAVDITFLDAEGNEAEPAGPVRVALTSETVEQARKDAETGAVADPVVVHVDDEGRAEQMDLVDPETIEPAAGRSEEEITRELEEDRDEQDESGAVQNEAESAARTGQADTAPDTAVEAGESAGEGPDASGPDSAGLDTDAATVGFTAGSFSVYAIVYTVDFHYNIDGQSYDYSIKGGEAVSLKELLPVLNVMTDDKATEADEVQTFVNDIDTVRFSDESLVKVVRIEEDTTAGKLKEKIREETGAEIEYSGELTEDQIAGMDAKELKAVDWALVSLKAFDTEETLTVSMKSGEVFTVKVTDARDPLGLDGRTFAIVNQRYSESQTDTSGNGRRYALSASISTGSAYSWRGNYFYSNDVTESYYYDTDTEREYCGEEAIAWKFEYNGEEDAYYVSAGGKYLYIDPSITDKTQSSTNSLALVDDKDRADKGTLIRISTDGNGNYRFSGYNEDSLTLWDYGKQKTSGSSTTANGMFWLDSGDNDPNGNMRLCLPEAVTSTNPNGASHKASLTSVQDLQPGQSVVIYQRIKQQDNTFISYAIADDPDAESKASLYQLQNSSDSVYWRGDPAILWKFTEATDAEGNPNGYYYFVNEKTGRYLAAKADGTLVQTLTDTKFDDLSKVVKRADHVQIALPGLRTDSYTSRIANWDYNVSVTSAPLVNDTDQNGVPESVTSESLIDSQEFYFAVRDPIVQKQLTEVETVDSISEGIKITMYDFSSSSDSTWSNYHQHYGRRLPYMNYVIGTPQWNPGRYYPDIVSPTLATDNNNGNMAGFPNTVPSNRDHRSYYWTRSTGDVEILEGGHSLGRVFYPEANALCDYESTVTEDVNHLFLKSVYDATGYFRYSSFENFARLDTETGDFKVYEQIGTPAAESYLDDFNSYYMNRGNFMPYNDLDLSSPKANNYESDSDQELDDTDPRKGENLYFLKGRPVASGDPDARNYYFGMIMEAKFQQDKEGINRRGDPVRYDFNGDDDLWVYIDGVLVLDIGGVHDAFQGYIDFNTGDVEVYPVNASTQQGYKATIKRRFWEAGRFPDGTPWDNTNEANYTTYMAGGLNLVDEYFDGNTLKDYSSHDFKMFYMERGAGASNLDLQFNLTTRLRDEFRITKEMPETSTGHDVQGEYGNAAFFYKAHRVQQVYNDQTNEYEDVESTIKKTDIFEDGKTYEQMATYDDGKTPLVWHTDEIFEVRPGQSAVFPVVNPSVRYYVEEVEPDDPAPDGSDPGSSMLDNFAVENSSPAEGQPEDKALISDVKSVQQRSEVIYSNKPDDGLVNELRIKKNLHGGMITDGNGTPLLSAVGSPYFEYAIYLENNDGKMVPYAIGPYYVIDKYGRFVYYKKTDDKRHYYGFERNADGTYSYYTVSPAEEGDDSEQVPEFGSLIETTRNPKITEYTGEEGYVGDVRDGDTLVIVGLLEGTHFIVDENCYGENDFITLDENENAYLAGNKYLFERIDVNEYVHVSGEDLVYNEHATGHLFNDVDASAVSVSSKAEEGDIRLDNDTEVVVHNRSLARNIPIIVEKHWEGIDADDASLAETEIKVTLGRYILKDKSGTLTVKKTGVPAGVSFTAIYTVRDADDRVIANIPYRAGVGSQSGVTITVPEGTYTVTETIRSQDETWLWNHYPQNGAGVGASLTTEEIPDGGSATVTFTCAPEVKTGTLKVSASYTAPDDGTVDFSGVTYTVYEGDETSTTRASYVNGSEVPVITFAQANASGGFPVEGLKVGKYTVREEGVPFNYGDYTLDSYDHEVTGDVEYDTTTDFSFTNAYKFARTDINYYIGKPSGWGASQHITGTNSEFSPGDTVKLTFYCTETWDKIANAGTAPGMYGVPVVSYGGETLSYNHYSENWNSRYEITFTVKENATLTVYVNADPKYSNQLWDMSWSKVTGSRSLSAASMKSAMAKAGARGIQAAGDPVEGEDSDETEEAGGTSGIDYGKTPTAPEGKKYVYDATFTVQDPEDPDNPDARVPYYVVLTLADYAYDEEEEVGAWIRRLTDLPEYDENGNKYYYYIEEVEETGEPAGTTTTVKLDGKDKFIVGVDKNLDTDQTPPVPLPLEITNTVVQVGDLKITKAVTVNDDPTTTSPLTSGTYVFTIDGVPGTDTANEEHTVKITFVNGRATKYQIDENAEVTVTGTDNTWEVIVPDLPAGDYTITESDSGNLLLKTVTGGKGDGNVTSKTITVTVTVNEQSAPQGTAAAVFTNNMDTVNAEVRKNWIDTAHSEHRPASLGVQFSNGTRVTLDEENDWSAIVTGLPKYDHEGALISYTWTEDTVGNGYMLISTSEDEETASDGTVTTVTTLSNGPDTHYNPPTSFTGTKTWYDDGTNRPDSITVILYKGEGANKTEVERKVIEGEAGSNEWSYEFTNLPVFDEDGKPVVYSVGEELPSGYADSYFGSVNDATSIVPAYTRDPDRDSVNIYTPNNEMEISAGVDLGFVVIKHGNDFIIWTPRKATAEEITLIKHMVHGAAVGNNDFSQIENFTPVLYWGVPSDKIKKGNTSASIFMDGDTVKIDFGDKNWSSVAMGKLAYAHTPGRTDLINTQKFTDFQFHKKWLDMLSLETAWEQDIEVKIERNKADGTKDGTFFLEYSLPAAGITNGAEIASKADTAGGTTNDPKLKVHVTTESGVLKYRFELKDLAYSGGDDGRYTYYVTETNAKLDGYYEPTYSNESAPTGSDRAFDEGTIINQQEGGAELPSAGGFGTNMLYLLGAVFVLLAGGGFAVRHSNLF